ncbi:flagellar biosynthesis protein FliQ [Flagellatimonas centrodinii]|uniref:flagellar biosynthesis protein FliQ n=1 Tax=Flagellatimonas centrodinii TaxID=2806210 RepID=UPI001FEDBD56|nr:flagellar biosynthesis protein FliQ [Flagellatimonas centrodinii]ULQ45651.1 flagellar biosynthesis protein FliQ [Flagellatimonas centrodinii]
MTPEDVLTQGRAAIEVAVLLAAPLLLAALLSGLLIGLFQAATQINEMTLSFIPKVLAVAAALTLTGPWMLRVIVDYTRALILSIPQWVG